MSNILIIKHGSLGDIVQISGILKDLRETLTGDKIFILTTLPYVELLSRCPFIDYVLIDKRLPRWNILYLLKLRKLIKKYNFSSVYDLQNSSRTSFYRKFLFKIQNWNSAEIAFKKKNKLKNIKENSILERFKMQLDFSKIKTSNCLKPDFSWAVINVNQILNQYFSKEFVLLFPFCSPNLPHKQWPYYNNLINIIKSKHANLEIVIAPGPSEFDKAKSINATIITNNNKSLNIMELAGLVKKSSFVIANDTGPAHIAAHLEKKGVVLFGYHTTAKKVSIETDNFFAITVGKLKDLYAVDVYEKIKDKLKSIN